MVSTGKAEAKAGDAAEPAENGEEADEGPADKLDNTTEKKE